MGNGGGDSQGRLSEEGKMRIIWVCGSGGAHLVCFCTLLGGGVQWKVLKNRLGLHLGLQFRVTFFENLGLHLGLHLAIFGGA